MSDTHLILKIIDEGGAAALSAPGPEAAIHELVQRYFELLGDRTAYEQPGSLKPGEQNYFIAGAFIVTPDKKYHMLVGNVGFPAEQRRLLVPIDGGHPGWVYLNQRELLLENTDDHSNFRQYLKSSRMGSTIFAPMFWQGEFMGQIVMAAQARYTMRQCDLDALKAISRLAAALWVAHGGPEWLAGEYPPADGFYVDREGVR